jgi:general secretion pathway protein G
MGVNLVARPRARTRGTAGFTLVELLVVLAIMGLLVGVVGPRVIGYLSDSKVKTAQIQMDSIATGLDLYHLDLGRYPSTAEGLAALVQKPAAADGWRGPYLKAQSAPKDPWGRAYVYRAPGQSQPFELGSVGAEGREGDQIAIRRSVDAPK